MESNYKKHSDFITPQYEEFCDILYGKLYLTTKRYVGLKETFTLFIRILDRRVEQEDGKETLIYGGLKKQRQELEGYDKIHRATELDIHWNGLKKDNTGASKTVKSSKLYDEYLEGKLDIGDITGNKDGKGEKYLKLDRYFQGELNPRQEHEEVILKYHLQETFTEYEILSLPLIQFAEFEGVVHIVFNEKEEKQFESKIKELIKIYSEEIENLILDWDIVGDNIEKSSMVSIFDKIDDPEYYKKINQNPIFKELIFLDYYHKNKEYFISRIQQNNAVFEKLLYQYRKSAVTAILIDSFAHNMSAHSLTALNWWFQKRAKLLEQKDKEKFRTFDDSIPDSFKSEAPLADSIHPLLKFLLEKGAFWTGVNRERNFGGVTISLFDVLWDNFIRNPLFLGSIAYSEKILKLNIKFTIIERSGKQNEKYGFVRNKKIKKHKDVLLNGILAKIDLEKVYDADVIKKDEEVLSHFIEKGKYFKEFKEALLEYKIFFPSGVTGFHAFFTILENEIRNVKHFSSEQKEKMKEEGLTLNISIEDNYIDGLKDVLYKIGIWLDHESCITEELVTGRLKKLESDIITSDFKPKLGGTYQDKVCAAMLFNNVFMSVQSRESVRDKTFYPWVKSGFSDLVKDEQEFFEDYEVSWRNYKGEENQNYLNDNIKTGKGYFKKFINLWKGELIKKINNENIGEPDNISRFKFVEIPEGDDKLFAKVREKDIVRIIHNAEDTGVEIIYPLWLNKWLEKGNYSVNFIIDDETIGRIIFDDDGVLYYNTLDLNNSKLLSSEQLNEFDMYQSCDFYLKHGNIDEDLSVPDDSICNYRSHGTFMTEFCNQVALHKTKISSGKAAELLELLLTNICIFDNRIANRVDKVNKAFYRNSLGAAIYQENVDQWNEVKNNNFEGIHFLVIHLSFIEAFEVKGDKKYNEEKIIQFLEDQVFQNEENSELRQRAGKNFMIVVTSGRGRSDWWNTVKDNETYNKFVTFRQVESLITATEIAMSINDDIEIKYQLCKVLFGS